MKLNQQLADLKQLIGQGELEQALAQLLALLEAGGEHYAEFAQTARINQAELAQLTARQRRGTVSEEDARLATNRISENILEIIDDLAAGRAHPGGEKTPARRQVWRYYLIGGIVALTGALVWWFVIGPGAKKDDCPNFGKDPGLCVMILPFKQTGTVKGDDPEFLIMQGLNKLIGETPNMQAIADVHERYDIEANFPNPAEAADIARGCNAQMLVWGLVNQSDGGGYKLDVSYKLLDAGGVRFSGNTTISSLLTVTAEGHWVQDVESVTRLLFFVLANQLRMPIAANLLADFQQETKSLADDVTPDSTTSLVLADYYLRTNQPEKALAEYDRVLEAFPDQPTALLGRGTVRYAMKDYTGAARDLEVAVPTSKTSLPAYREVRVDAFLKSGQPEKATQELDNIRTEGVKDSAWVDDKARETRDSIAQMSRRAEKLEKLAKQNPKDKKTAISAAKARNGIGDPDAALKVVDPVLRADPKNLAAVQAAVESHMQKGDTLAARKVIDRAVSAGANVKSGEWQTVVGRVADKKAQMKPQ